MRRQMQNKGELAVMVVCVVVGFLLAAQLRSVKLAGRPTPPTPAAWKPFRTSTTRWWIRRTAWLTR
ncbi:MAG: hypothetical protein ACLRNQ_22310 [Flavonifractor plautii]